MTHIRAVVFSCAALALAGCQGGTTNLPTLAGPPQTATQTQTISPAGGDISVALGTQVIAIHVPPGATAGPATFTLTIYAAAANPKAVSSTQRATKALPTDAAGLLQFQLDDGGVPLLKPLTASLVTPALSAGVFRLAGFGTLNFTDVDTVTYGSGAANSDGNTAFARMSLANHTFYEFYTTAKAAAAPTPVIASVTILPGSEMTVHTTH